MADIQWEDREYLKGAFIMIKCMNLKTMSLEQKDEVLMVNWDTFVTKRSK